MIAADAPPAALPAGLDEAKAYLRIASDAEDATIAALLRVGTQHCERFTGLALIARDVVEIVPASPCWRRLALTPVRAITGVSTLAADGTETALEVDGYAIDIDANGDGWVRVTAADAGTRARVTYQAGMAADANGVPEPLRQGIVRLTAHLFANRDAADEGAPPAAVAALWRPWRRMRLI